MSYLRNHKLLLLVIGVLLVANIGLLWNFVWKKPPTPPKPPSARERMIQEVGFTDEQVIIYDSLRDKHYKSIKPMFRELRHSKDSLFKLMHQPLVSDSLIENQSAIICEKQQAIDLKVHHYFGTIRDLCTEEQKPRMDAFLQDLAKRMSAFNRRGPGSEQKNNNEVKDKK